MRRYYVYIMASKSRVLYIGVTGDIWQRVLDHRNNVNEGFTSKYRCHRLVYFETFKYVGNAIRREKELKGWLRKKKVALIYGENPTWEDLSLDWYGRIAPLPVRTWGGVEKAAGVSSLGGSGQGQCVSAACNKQVLRCAQDDKR